MSARTGAGFSRDIFKIGKEHNVPIVMIVSSPTLAKLAEKLGAAAIIVEFIHIGNVPASPTRNVFGFNIGYDDEQK